MTRHSHRRLEKQSKEISESGGGGRMVEEVGSIDSIPVDTATGEDFAKLAHI